MLLHAAITDKPNVRSYGAARMAMRLTAPADSVWSSEWQFVSSVRDDDELGARDSTLESA